MVYSSDSLKNLPAYQPRWTKWKQHVFTTLPSEQKTEKNKVAKEIAVHIINEATSIISE